MRNRTARNVLLAGFIVGTAAVVAAAFVTATPVRWVTLGLVLADMIVCLAPFWLEAGHKPFDPFHPLVFLFLVYWVPMVVVKGSQLALGGESFVLLGVAEPLRCLNLALFYSGVGWSSAILGFYSPIGTSLNRWLRFPRFAAGRDLVTPIRLLVIFSLGVLVNLALIKQGTYGSSLTEVQGPLLTLSILRPLSLWPLMVGFLVVFMMGRQGRLVRWLLLLLVVLGMLGGLAALSGSRAYLFQVVLALACAHVYGRGLERGSKTMFCWLGAAVLALILGTAVMSEYRSLRFMRYGEDAISPGQTLSTVKEAAENTLGDPVTVGVNDLPERFAERFNSIEFLGVTIGLADSLRSEERELGMDNNIAKEIAWVFVPRPLWPDKPRLSDFGNSFAHLYLDIAGHTSAAPSMIGDLFRNFRVPGIVLGMFAFGVYLRVIYGVLVVHSSQDPVAVLVYWSLLMAVSLEGTYLSFFSGGTRNLFAVAGILLALLVGRGSRVRAGVT